MQKIIFLHGLHVTTAITWIYWVDTNIIKMNLFHFLTELLEMSGSNLI